MQTLLAELLKEKDFVQSKGFESLWTGRPDDKKIKERGFTIEGNFAVKFIQTSIDLIKKHQTGEGEILFYYHDRGYPPMKKLWSESTYRGLALIRWNKRNAQFTIEIKEIRKFAVLVSIDINENNIDDYYKNLDEFGSASASRIKKEDIRQSVKQALQKTLNQ